MNTELSRIYFDSNSLYGWPSASRQVFWLSTIARWLSIELYWPEAVEFELEEQFMRDVSASAKEMLNEHGHISKRLATIGHDDIARPELDLASIRETYLTKTKSLKAQLGIATIPTGAPALSEIVRMASKRTPPFQELKKNAKNTAVTGFQDSVILFSVLNHLGETPLVKAALLSNDSVFRSSEVLSLISQKGVQLQIYKNIAVLIEELWGRISPVIKKGWEADFEKAQMALESMRDRLEQDIPELVDLEEIDRDESVGIVELKGVHIKEIQFVKTELPAIDSLPPYTSEFSRKPGNTQITATASAIFDAIVTQTELWQVWLRVRYPDAVAPEPEARQIWKLLDLILDAEFDGNEYSGLKLISVSVHR